MEAIVIYLLKSSGILAIFFFSYQFFLKKETFFRTNRHYLLAGILGSLLLPLVIFTNYIYVESSEPFNPNWLFTDIPISYSVVEEAEPFNWLQFVTYVYLIGVLIFGIRFAVQLISLIKLFKTNSIKKEERFNLVEINSNIAPFSFFNYIVYNPNNYAENDLEIIINHEKAHSNQFHSIDILLSQLFVTLQWFNPIAWLYKKSIQQNLEFMADQFAISKVESAKQYQHTLLKASLKPQYASITNNFYNSLIKKRIIMLNQSKSNIKNIWKYFIILPALALFLMSFNVETVEVEKPVKELPFFKENYFNSENNIQNNLNPSIISNSIPKGISNNTLAPETINLQELIKKRIDKNTTDAELKTISEDLKKKGILFTYKNVKRNSNNEITGINITYKDIKGNSGNYALSSESPINTFYFFKEENGSIGFKSDNANTRQHVRVIEEGVHSNADREALMKERERMMEERNRTMEEHKALSEERRREIEVRVEKAREEHKLMREEHEKEREEYKKQRKIIIEERMKLHDSLKDKHGNIFIEKHKAHDEGNLFFAGKEKVLFIVDGEESDGAAVELISPNNIMEMNVFKGDQAIKVYGDKGKDGVVIIKTKPHGENHFVYEVEHDINEPHVNVQIDSDKEVIWISKDHKSGTDIIKKNTTDAELKRMKSNFENKKIEFKYSKLKRNKNGEITRIKISLNDNEGNKSSSTFDTGNKAINPILLGKTRNNLVIKSI